MGDRMLPLTALWPLSSPAVHVFPLIVGTVLWCWVLAGAGSGACLGIGGGAFTEIWGGGTA